MSNRPYRSLAMVVGGSLALTVTLSALISRAQQEPEFSFAQEQAGELADSLSNALYTKRIAHPACPNCFKVDDGRYGVYEDVPGTGILIPREIPDPAPLKAGESRPEFDEEGEPIWYIGHQGVVGPTDEDPINELPIPKIKLRRIHARHIAEIFRIRGVHGFGIGERGFSVFLDPKYLKNQNRIPIALEGIPVEIEEASPPTFRSHFDLMKRPVEVADGIVVDGAGSGTLGPHIVRNSPTCCQIWSLTAAHVVQEHNEPPPAPGQRDVYQALQLSGNLWGKVAHSWSALACNTIADPYCTRPSAPINWTNQTPDVAAIAHISLSHTDPPRSSTYIPTGLEPTRKMRYGRSSGSIVNGPSGIIRTPSIGTTLKMWGSRTDASNAKRVTHADLSIRVDAAPFSYKFCCVMRLDILSVGGDSGGLIAYDGTGNRHIAGVLFAGDNDSQGNPIVGTYFTKAIDIYDAFNHAGVGFHHFWGTASGYQQPAVTTCDGSC